jgi:hypothetical protein
MGSPKLPFFTLMPGLGRFSNWEMPPRLPFSRKVGFQEISLIDRSLKSGTGVIAPVQVYNHDFVRVQRARPYTQRYS